MNMLFFSFGLSTLFCLLLAIGLITSRALNPLCARMLGVNYLLFTVQGALGVMVFTGFWPQAVFPRVLIAMLLGPALYGYFISALSPQDFKRWRWYWHILPALLMALVLWQRWWPLIDPMIIASFTAYGLTVLWRLKRAGAHNQIANRQITPAAKAWLWILVALMPVNILIEIAIVMEIRAGAAAAETYALRVGGVISALFHAFTLILALVRAPVIEWMHELKRAGVSELGETEKQQLFKRWQQLVEDRELYRAEQSMTVARAARLLGVPARQLSQAVNGAYGASFSQYLNDVRVERAKALLQSRPDLTITDILMEAGFSAKSHFHREFARVVGLTPSAYRDQTTRP